MPSPLVGGCGGFEANPPSDPSDNCRLLHSREGGQISLPVSTQVHQERSNVSIPRAYKEKRACNYITNGRGRMSKNRLISTYNFSQVDHEFLQCLVLSQAVVNSNQWFGDSFSCTISMLFGFSSN